MRTGLRGWRTRTRRHRAGQAPTARLALTAITCTIVLLAVVATQGQAGHVNATERAVYSAAEVAHFEVLGLGSEYGEASPVVRKWRTPVRVGLAGGATAVDRAALSGTIAELAALIDPVRIELVDSTPNLTVHLVPSEAFAATIPGYVPGNDGFFRVWWHDDILDRAEVVVDTGAPPAIRAHLICHEVTQSLGLMIDSADPNSVLFSHPTKVTSLTSLDRAALRLLYDTRVRPGMSAAQVEAAIRP